jgi:NTE family protein
MSKSIELKNSDVDSSLDNGKTKPEKKNNNIFAFAGPEQIVYEYSEVFLEGHSIPINQKLIWKQIDGPKVDLKYENIEDEKIKVKNPYFMTPYIALDFDNEQGNRTVDDKNNKSKPKPYVKLTFELIAKNETEIISSPPATVNIIVKMVQRALVFQGGGSLGAYEAGVFKSLCKHLTKKDKEIQEKKNRPIFDVIAGSSIGAVNAAIIVGIIKKKMDDKNDRSYDSVTATALQDSETMWKNAATGLDNFWNDISYPTWWLDNDFFNQWWNGLNNITKTNIQNYKAFLKENETIYGGNDKNHYPFSQLYFYDPQNMSPVASAESARRYFSWIHFLFAGVPNVMSPNLQQPDTKFFMGIPSFARFDNTPLVKTIKKYWDYENYPLKTYFERGEPRLLLVSVDVMDAASAVTFDSYLCKTKYTDGLSITDTTKEANNGIEEENNFNYVIEYPDGISIEHVNASMSPHLRYQYPKFKAYSERERKEIDRYFWDGAYLSNTPLREMIQAHRDYWYEEGNEERKYVPHLEVYIVNLYPTVEKENELPKDADTIEDREMDIRFHDRTQYDIKVAQIISDYIVLYGQVKNLAIKHLEKLGPNKSKGFLEDLENILNTKVAKSQKRGGGGIEDLIQKNKKEKNEDKPQDNNCNFDYHNGDGSYQSTTTSNRRKYKDIIEGRFDIAKVIYIDRKDDGNTIFGKAAEFSASTINKLKEDGYNEANKILSA